ncbi:MAG: hypothetical protein R3B70_28780 [Polyangiaceae bacterium]
MEAIRHAAPSRAASAYFAVNDFVIESGRPVAFYGPSYLLEALAMSRGDTVKNILAHGLLPRKSLTFLMLHASADVGHVRERRRRPPTK